MNISININLLPWREELKEQQKREFLVMLGVGALIASGLILFVHLWINSAISFQQYRNSYLKEQITELDKKIAEIEALKKEKQQLLAKMDIIQELQANRPQIVRLFDGIVKTVPEGLFLTNLTRTGSKILLDGKAESNTRVSTFMRNIDSSNWLKQPMLSLIQAEDKEGQKNKVLDRYIGFNLQADETVSSTLLDAQAKNAANAEAKSQGANATQPAPTPLPTATNKP